jgi:hypothetical protein
MKLLARSNYNFGLTKFLYDSAYIVDPNHKGYKVAGSPVNPAPQVSANIQ